MSDLFVKIKKLLYEDNYVMFVGTPCQVAGLKKFLLKDYEKLLTIDLVCRGVISQKVYIDYLKSVERHTKSKITEVNRK